MARPSTESLGTENLGADQHGEYLHMFRFGAEYFAVLGNACLEVSYVPDLRI